MCKSIFIILRNFAFDSVEHENCSYRGVTSVFFSSLISIGMSRKDVFVNRSSTKLKRVQFCF